jgi:hypothetical protein
MKTLLFFLLLSYTAFAQNDLDITGDWILSSTHQTLTPIQTFKLEHFSKEYYIGALEYGIAHLSLYKIRTFKVRGKLFLDLIELNKEQNNPHYFWSVQKVFKDSANVSLLINFPIDLGNKDIINRHGQVLMIDTSKIDFELTYSQSDTEYIAKENTWKSPSKARKVVLYFQNPLLFEYLIRKYKDKIKGRPFTYYRWSFFTWDKVNTLKSKDIVSIPRLDKRKVFSIFETATPEDLIQFKVGEKSTAQIKAIGLQLNNYHLIRANSIDFVKSPSFWIVSFKDGRKIKVKTNIMGRRLYDATNKKLYSSEERNYW